MGGSLAKAYFIQKWLNDVGGYDCSRPSVISVVVDNLIVISLCMLPPTSQERVDGIVVTFLRRRAAESDTC